MSQQYHFNNTSNCGSSNNDCSNTIDASNVIYTGSNLTCISVNPNTNLQVLLGLINTAICNITGINWSSFDYSCLAGPIVTAQDFAEGISNFACTLSTNFTNFQTNTYTPAISSINSSINSILHPGLTSCAAVNIQNTDSYSTILTKILTNLCSVNTSINPSGANWNSCYTVTPNPINITDAFNAVLNQICDLKNKPIEVNLPLFDNNDTCISGTGGLDSVYDTLVRLRDYTCDLPTFNINDVSWTTCIPNPNVDGGADLTGALNQLLPKVDSAFTKRVVTFDPSVFAVTNHSVGDACSGLNVTLQAGVGLSDKLVALNGGDTSPNYLLSKITAGTNISFDTSTAPGTVIIKATSDTYTVKADTTGTTPGFLSDKIVGQSDGTSAISLIASYNSGTDQLDITPTIAYSSLAQNMMTAILDNPTLLAQFCGLACGCNPCSTTTTTTTISPIWYDYEIHNFAASEDYTLTLFNNKIVTTPTFNGSVFLVATGSISSGHYTGPYPAASGQISLKNDGAIDFNYSIGVIDNASSTVPGASSQSGTITVGSTVIINPFNFGTSPNNYRVVIQLSEAT